MSKKPEPRNKLMKSYRLSNETISAIENLQKRLDKKLSIKVTDTLIIELLVKRAANLNDEMLVEEIREQLIR